MSVDGFSCPYPLVAFSGREHKIPATKTITIPITINTILIIKNLKIVIFVHN